MKNERLYSGGVAGKDGPTTAALAAIAAPTDICVEFNCLAFDELTGLNSLFI